MESDPEEPLVYLHDQSPEAIEAAPIARELLRARLSPSEKGTHNGVLNDFQRHREDESEAQWQVRQTALIGCLERLAAEALLVAYEDDDGHRDEAGIRHFFKTLAEQGITL
jgi:hypothetical protein